MKLSTIIFWVVFVILVLDTDVVINFLKENNAKENFVEMRDYLLEETPENYVEKTEEQKDESDFYSNLETYK